MYNLLFISIPLFKKKIQTNKQIQNFLPEYAIFKCGLYCKAVSHFHCPKCSKLVEKKNKFLEHLVKCVGTVTHEDRENPFLLKEEPEWCNLSMKEDADSCRMSEEQDGHPAVVLGEEVSHLICSYLFIYSKAVGHFLVICFKHVSCRR